MKPSNLKRLRLDLGLTPGYCANGMGVSRQTICNIENGTTKAESSRYFYELYLKDVKRRRDYARERREADVGR